MGVRKYLQCGNKVVQHFKDQFKTWLHLATDLTSIKYHLNLINYHYIDANGPDFAFKPAIIQ